MFYIFPAVVIRQSHQSRLRPLIFSNFITRSCSSKMNNSGKLKDAEELPHELRLYQEMLSPGNGTLPEDVSDVHMNPANHWTTLRSDPESSKVPFEKQFSLNVSVLGVPNAGKSTLVNSLAGAMICPYSSKVHTTRRTTRAVWTVGEKQIVFRDTPGLVSEKELKKFKLEESLFKHPKDSCEKTDLIVVVQDVSNRYVREALDKKVLRLLCLYHDTPSILILNKIDTIPKSRRVFDLIRKLTCNSLEGKLDSTRVIPQTHHIQDVDEYLRSREKREFRSSEKRSMSSLSEVKTFFKDRPNVSEEEIREFLKGRVGWSGFKDVFAISSTEGTGLEIFRDYLLYLAKPRPWTYSNLLRTAEDPRDIVLNAAKAKFLDMIPFDVPYRLKPMIETWLVENGVLRIGIAIESRKSRHTSILLENSAVGLREASRALEKDLQNFFQCEVFVSINVIIQHEKKVETKNRKTIEPQKDVFI